VTIIVNKKYFLEFIFCLKGGMEVLMALLWMLMSALGLIVGYRTLMVCESLRIFSEKRCEPLAIFISALILLLNSLLREHLLAQFFLLVCLFLSPLFLTRIIFSRRERQVLKNFVSILDLVVVRMRIGSSLRESLLATSADQPHSTQFLLREFVTLLSFDRPLDELVSHPRLRKNFLELKKIDQQPHRAIERLKSLRRRLQLEEKLRQKSRKALLQARAQATILSILYAALLSYSLCKYGWKNSPRTFAVSLGAFFAGSLWLWQMGRRFRWKI
jgi:hypothetical protein